MVSAEQLEALIGFLENKPELALGRFNRSTEGRSLAKRMWREGADVLNSIAPDCVRKEPEGWRMFYNEYKSKLLKKIRAQKREFSATGGGPAKKINLTPLQERLYNILGRDVGEPLPGVRHNPLQPQALPTDTQEGSQYIIYEAMVDDMVPELSLSFEEADATILHNEPAPTAEPFASYRSTHEEQREPTPSTSAQSSTFAQPSTTSKPSTSQPSTSQPSTTQPSTSQPSTTQPSTSQPSTSQPSTSSYVQRRAEQRNQREQSPLLGAPSAPPTQRRRRRHTEESLPPPTALESAEARLAQLERANAEATLKHAQATNRLADAIQQLAAAAAEGSLQQARAISQLAEASSKQSRASSLLAVAIESVAGTQRAIFGRRDGGSPAKKRWRRLSD